MHSRRNKIDPNSMLAQVPRVPAWVLILATVALMSPLTLISLDIVRYFNQQLAPDAWRKYYVAGQRALDKGDYSRAENLLKLAVKSAQDANKSQPRLIQSLSALQDVYSVQLKYDDMRVIKSRLQEVLGQVPAVDPEAVAAYKTELEKAHDKSNAKKDSAYWRDLVDRGNELALQYAAANNTEAGEDLLQQALSVVQEILGPKDPTVGLAFHDLGRFYELQQDMVRAQPYFAQSMDLLSKPGDTPKETLARCLYEQGNFFRDQADLKRARRCVDKSLSMYMEIDPQSKSVADLHYFLGYMYMMAKMDGESNRQLAKAEEMYRSGPSASSAGMANCQALRAMRMEELRDYRGAAALYAKALSMFEDSEGKVDEAVLPVLRGLARVSEREGDYQTAEPLLRRAIAIQERAPHQDPQAFGSDFEHLALLYEGMHQPEQARAIRDEARLKLGSL